jgi:hypothetical protein
MRRGKFDATQSSQGVNTMISSGALLGAAWPEETLTFVDIMTPLLYKIIETTDDVTWLENASPFNHLGQPKDIGQEAVWLASGRESGYVSIDGGFLAR